MNQLSFLILFLFAIHDCFTQRADTILIKNVNVIPMTEEVVLENQNVLISAGRIISIGADSISNSIFRGQIIDGTDKFLIPGLSEMHYHWRSTESGIERDLKLLIANGITTARNMAEYAEQDHVAIANRIKSGEVLGPDYYTTGPYLKKEQLKTKEQIDDVIAAHVSKKYDFLKLADNLPKELYIYLLKEAHENGIPVIGHAQRKLPLEYSLRMKSIEHVEDFVYVFNKEENWSYLNNNIQELYSTADKIQQSGIFITPTLVVFETLNQYLDDSTFLALQKDSMIKYLPSDQRTIFLTERNEYRGMKNFELDGIKASELFGRYFI